MSLVERLRREKRLAQMRAYKQKRRADLWKARALAKGQK